MKTIPISSMKSFRGPFWIRRTLRLPAGVAQICHLLYRGFATRRAFGRKEAGTFREPGRVQLGDTAECNSALRASGARSRRAIRSSASLGQLSPAAALLLAAAAFLFQPSIARAQKASTNALNLDGGANAYARMGSGVWFSNQFTVESWVYLRANANWSRLFDFGNGPGTNNVLLALSRDVTGQPWFEFRDGAGNPVGTLLSPSTIPSNVWTHLACTYDGAVGRIFINGNVVASANMGSPTNVFRTNNFIGRSNWTNDSNANAIFDEFRIWSVARSAAEIQSGATRLLTGGEPGLLTWLRFEESSGALASDTPPRGLSATLFSGATFTNRTVMVTAPEPPVGPFNPAITFDGVDDAVLVPAVAGLGQGNTAHSIEAWIKTPIAPTPQRAWMLLLGNQGFGHHWLYHPNGDLQLGMWGPSDGQVLLPSFPSNQWTHLAVTYDGTFMRGYTNGTLFATSPGNIVINMQGNGLTLAQAVGAESYFAGQMDEVRVWGRAITAAEIQTNLAKRLTGRESGLLGYWRFDEGSGPRASDLTGRGGHGTLTNGVAWSAGGPVALASTRTALAFSNGAVVLGASAPALGANFTEEAWIFVPASIDTAYHGFLGYQPGGNPAERAPSLWVYGQTGLHGGYGTGSQWFNWTTTNGVLTLDAWNHVAATFNGTTYLVYVNGRVVHSATLPGTPGPSRVQWIGVVDNYFPGNIDEVRIWNVTRTAAQIQSTVATRLAGTEPGLVGYWRLDEGAGTATADQTGSGANGTFAGVDGGVTWTDSSPPFVAPAPVAMQGQALAFDGVNDFVRVDRPFVPTNGEYTVECWATTPNSLGAYRHILSQGLTGQNPFYLGIDPSGNIRAGDAWGATGVAFPSGGWHHLALTRTASDAFLYLDGTLMATKGSALPSPSSAAFVDIGKQFENLAEHWLGGIDEVRVWNVARNRAQIQTNMATLLTGREPGLVAYFRMDDAGATTLDAVGAVPGRLTNGAVRVASTAPILPGSIFGHVTGLSGNNFPGATLSAQTAPLTNATAAAIADLTSTNRDLFVPFSISATNVRVAVNITHPRIGDLALSLIAPDGTLIRLRATNSETAANIVTSYPDQTASLDSMTALNGKPTAGLWRLTVSDQRAASTGTLNSWNLSFGPATTTSDANGFYTLASLGAGTFTVTPGPSSSAFSPTVAVVPAGRGDVNFGRTFLLVTNVNDSGPGSLRQTIADAIPGDIVNFAPGLSGSTILVTNGPVVLDRNITLDASALPGGLRFDGGHTSQVFNVAGGATVTLNSLTIANGAAVEGAGIYNAGTLTVNQSTFIGNQGTLDGGGIKSVGSLTLTGCSFFENSAYEGGAVRSVASLLQVDNCTFANNSAEIGGAISAADGGPAALFRHLTVVGNTATNGFYGGGGVFFHGKLATFLNSLIAGNTAPIGPDIRAMAGSVVTNSAVNWIGDLSDSGLSAGAGLLTGTNPQVGPRGSYGGRTQSMPPLPGSPALNAAIATPFATDQRGFPRIVGASADLGAVELQTLETFVTSAADTGNGSLRSAITDSASGTVIYFAGNLGGQTIQLASELALTKPLVIDAGNLASGVTIRGWADQGVAGSFRLFNVTGAGNLTLRSLTLAHGGGMALGGNGGAIYAESPVTLIGCTLTGNVSTYNGGAIFNYTAAARLTLVHCTLTANSCSNSFGGAICNDSGIVVIRQCTVSGNSAPAGNGAGGGLFNFNGSLAVTNSIVAGNTSTTGGQDINNNSVLAFGGSNLVQHIVGGYTGPAPIAALPLLAPPGNYGGLTHTMPPLPGSAAMDAGHDAAATPFSTDQRGLARLVGARSDIGSVEVQPAGQRIRIALNGVTNIVRITLAFGGVTTNLLTDANGALDAAVPWDAYLPYTITPQGTSLPGLVFSPPTATNVNGTVNFTVLSGVISGRVAAGATGISNAVITFTPQSTNGSGPLTLTTDANGNYASPPLAIGPYTVAASLSGTVLTPASQTALAGAANVNFNFVSGVVAGRVTGGTNGVAGMPVQLLHAPVFNTNWLTVPDTRSVTSSIVIPHVGVIGLARVAVDISHSFRGDLALTLIAPNNAQVRLKVSDVNDDWFDVYTSYPDEDLPVDDLASLNGLNMAGTWKLKVDDQFAEDSGVLHSWSLMLGVTPINTDSGGYYTYGGLPYDYYFVQPVRAETTFTPPWRTVRVGATNADFAVDTTFLRGRITLLTSNGLPFAGVPLVLTGAVSATYFTENDGGYNITGLVPDVYTLTPTLAGHGFDPASITTNSGASNLNFIAVSFPISGRVVDLKTNGVPGVTLTTPGGTATTDADGAYRLNNMAPATYTIVPGALDTTFDPTNRVAILSNAAVTGIDFLVTQSPPSITPISNLVIRRFEGTGPIRFDIGDRESPASALRITVACSDPAIFADTNIVLGGESWYRTIAVTNLSGNAGTATITLSVSDGTLTTTRSFNVRVDSVPLAGIGSALQFNGAHSRVVAGSVIGNKGDFSLEAWVNVPWSATNTPMARTIFAQGASPVPGDALLFNGTNSAVEATNGPVLGTHFTEEAWIFPTPTDGGYHGIMGYASGGNATRAPGIWLYNYTAIAAGFGDGFTWLSWNSPAGLITTNAWNHIAVTYNGSTYRLYVNGSNVHSVALTGFPTPQPVRWVGRVDNYFPGRIDEVRIWNTNRSAAEIQANFTRPLAGTEANLLLYYSFDEGVGTVAANRAATGAAYHGTLTNGPVWLPAAGVTTNAFAFGYDAQGKIRVAPGWTNTGVTLPFGGWHHLALAKDNSNTFLYLDGVLAATRGGPLPMPPAGSVHLGSRGGSEVWLGGIEEVRVWKTARSQTDITNAMSQRFTGTEPELLGLWHFDEAANFLARDSASRSNHAGLTAAQWIQSGVVFDHYTVQEEAIITDYLPAYDPDGDPMTFQLVNPPLKGTVTLLNTNTGLFRYTAFTNVNGSDSFSFQANDGAEDSAIAFVVVNILADTNAPVLVTETNVVMAEDTVLGPLAVTVGDREATASQVTLTAYSSNESIVPATNIVFGGLSSNRLVTIRPATNAFGTNILIALVADDGQNAVTNVLWLTVTNVNDPPTITALENPIVPRGTATAPQSFTLADVDNNVSNLVVTGTSSDQAVIPNSNITITGNGAQRSVSVTPLPGLSGWVPITLTVSDGSGGVTNTTFSVIVDDPPTISAIGPQTTTRNKPTAPINFTVGDTETPVSSLYAYAVSWDETIVSTNIQVLGSAANRSLVITPEPGGHGVVKITVYVYDGLHSSSTDFLLEVLQGPLYQIEDLGEFNPVAINDRGTIAGHIGLRAFLQTESGLRDIGHLGYPWTVIKDLNNDDAAVGSGTSASYDNVSFLYRDGNIVNIDNYFGTNSATCRESVALNDFGIIALHNSMEFCGPVVASGFIYNGTNTVSLPSRTDPVALNNEGVVVGYQYLGPNSADKRAILNHPNNRGVNVLLTNAAPFIEEGQALAINERNGILGLSLAGGTNTGFLFIYDQVAGTYTKITSLFGDSTLTAEGGQINNFGQAVSTIIISNGYHAFLWSDGVGYEMDNQVTDLSDWLHLGGATGINNRGEIVGWGWWKDYSIHGFRLKPNWIIGEPIAPPLAAFQGGNPANPLYSAPSVQALDGSTGPAHVWSSVEKKLYFTRPVTARISWFTTSATDPASLSNNPPITMIGTAVWPAKTQTHVVGAPVQLNPVNGNSPYRHHALSYPPEGSGVTVEPSSATFNADRPGYSVLRYLRTGGQSPNPETQSNLFVVVRSVNWDDPAHLLLASATVGERAGDPYPPGVPVTKSGWLVYSNAYYDGVGADKAYDRATQTGPIIPVNVNNGDPQRNFVVAFYRPNSLGVEWADRPVRFDVQWPTNAPQIVIASGLGSGPLDPVLHPQKSIYNQPNRNLPGFNPNEEHALFAPGTTGEALFALRNDLNAVRNFSQPFALLKYRDPDDGQWTMKAYQVVVTNVDYPEFKFVGLAGNEIQPPYPLSLLPLCGSTIPVSGPYWRDKNDKIYARAGDTPQDPQAEIVVRYHYPIQVGFWYDLDNDGLADAPVGGCVPWLNRLSGAAGPPINTTYKIVWPGETPVLRIGDTLTTAKFGLPGVKNFASAQVVFDSLNPDGLTPFDSKVRLYDPYSPRLIKFSEYSVPLGIHRLGDGTQLPIGYVLPDSIKRENNGAKDTFVDLPYHLRSRLKFDPINKWLSWEGLDIDTGIGDPLVLINVMTIQERERIKQLSTDGDFRKIIDALYDLSRNPNRLDINQDGVPDRELLIGFTYEYTVRVTNSVTPLVIVTNLVTTPPTAANVAVLSRRVVPERLTGGAKALTAGLPFDPPMPTPGYAWNFNGLNSRIAVNNPGGMASDFTIEFWMRTTNTAGTEDANWNSWTRGAGLVDASSDAVRDDFGISLIGGRVYFGAGQGQYASGPLPLSGYSDFQRFQDRFRPQIIRLADYILAAVLDINGNRVDINAMLRPNLVTEMPPLDAHLFGHMSIPLKTALVVPEAVGFNFLPPPWDILNYPFLQYHSLVDERLASEVNGIVFPGNASIYTPGLFAGVTLSPETAGLLGKSSKSSAEWQRLNRLLLEDAYPIEVRRSRREMTVRGTFVADGRWHHIAAIRNGSLGTLTLMVDGITVATGNGPSGAIYAPAQVMFGQLLTGNSPSYQGLLDEVRLWRTARDTNEVANDFARKLTGSEANLAGYWLFDEGHFASTTANAIPSEWRNPGALANVTPVAVTSSQGANVSRYIVIAENNDPSLSGLPVTLHVIRFGDGPALGDLRVIYPDNVFDERLTLRHSGDFGGAPENLAFEWWTHPDSAVFDPRDVPIVDTNGVVLDARGWVLYKSATPGQNFVTIGEGGESSLFTLSDNWFLCRYRGYNVGGRTNWTRWIGDPASLSAPMAMLAPGWIKRVLEGINPFDQRVKDFHKSPIVTYSSMLMQAGARWEGDVALNPDPAAVNSVGLIQMYTTVLNRGRSLSIDGTPMVDSDPANNALMLAASRIADLYMLIGNEAVADAVDPTVSITVFSPEFSPEFSSRSSSLFAFQNQLDSLLEEELVLYRGRDDASAGVQGKPVYNRLIWNFTGGDGEVAYTHTYNMSDINFDGLLNEFDAKTLFPQGHGDAWGHYLTAAKTYYELLRHTNFTWVPRTEHVLVAGTSVEVDYLDERKFARIASARARAGREIVDLTYRQKYVEDPAGQYQGYKDTDTDRAWGVTEWARRAGQGAWFDWLTANTILPAKDPNTNHTGLAKIDRTTVTELAEIVSQHHAVQAVLDNSDAGLNPVGVAKGAVPFDIDPAAVADGSSHFDQVYDRAVAALRNTQHLWNDVNSLSRSLRRRQDATEEFTRNANDQERDFKNRLIEIFGYPYAGDIGPGGTYPANYDGPDLYHYMYVGATEIGAATAPPSQTFIGYYKPLSTNLAFFFPDDLPGVAAAAGGALPGSNVLAVSYPLSAKDFGFVAPVSYGQRRAPGEIQMALSDLVQAEARLKQSLVAYDNLEKDVRDALDNLGRTYQLQAENIRILNWQRNSIGAMNGVALAMKATQLTLRRIATTITGISEVVNEGIPKSVGLSSDALSGFRGLTKGVAFGVSAGFEIGADVAALAEAGMEVGKQDIELQAGIQLQIASQLNEVSREVKALEALMRQEPGLRIEAYSQAEIVRQTAGRFQAALAAGQRLLQERYVHRTYMAADVQEARYQDMAFRIFRNDALQKYRAQFDLSARYVYLAANAYDYEVNLLGSDPQAGQDFLTDIVRQRHVGVLTDGDPVVGQPGLADSLSRLKANWDVLRTQFGVNNPQTTDARFSMRRELFRIKFDESGTTDASAVNALSDPVWKAQLQKSVVPDLWQVPEFRRYCRPFAPELAGPQPGLVVRFSTTITYGLNFFGWPLSGGDSFYDPTLFSTRIGSAGVWFDITNTSAISATPRVYLVPVGLDVMRSPTGDTLATREWRILDQVIPEPFPIGASTINQEDWIPINDSLGGSFVQIRRYSSFPALMDSSYNADDLSNDSRLIGRSAWNTEWLLIIPGGTLLADPNAGLNAFIENVKDIKFYFETYSYSGN